MGVLTARNYYLILNFSGRSFDAGQELDDWRRHDPGSPADPEFGGLANHGGGFAHLRGQRHGHFAALGAVDLGDRVEVLFRFRRRSRGQKPGPEARRRRPQIGG